jgi:hypothetical protein
MFTSREQQVEWVLNSISRGVFIGVQGGVTDLIKSVTPQVLASRPSHVVGQPPSLASTDFKLRIPYYCLLESMPVRGCKVGLTSQGVWPAIHPLGPLVSGL